MVAHERTFLLFLLRNALLGVAVGWLVLAGLLGLDVARLGGLLLASEHRVVALVLLGTGFATTFGGLAAATALFLLPRREATRAAHPRLLGRP